MYQQKQKNPQDNMALHQSKKAEAAKKAG